MRSLLALGCSWEAWDRNVHSLERGMAAFAGKHSASHTTLPSPGVAALPPALSSWHLDTPQLLFFHPKSTDKVLGLCNE